MTRIDVNFPMQDSYLKSIEDMKESSESESAGIVINKALAVYKTLLEIMDESGTISIALTNGEKRKLSLLRLPKVVSDN